MFPMPTLHWSLRPTLKKLMENQTNKFCLMCAKVSQKRNSKKFRVSRAKWSVKVNFASQFCEVSLFFVCHDRIVALNGPFCRLWASPKSKPWRFFSTFLKKTLKNFMVPFYGWGSTASRLEPLRGNSLLNWHFFNAYYRWLKIIEATYSSIPTMGCHTIINHDDLFVNAHYGESPNNKLTDFFTDYYRQLQIMQPIFSIYYWQPQTSKLWWFFSAYQGQSSNNKFTLFFTVCWGKLQIIEQHLLLLTKGNPKIIFFKTMFGHWPIGSFISDVSWRLVTLYKMHKRKNRRQMANLR